MGRAAVPKNGRPRRTTRQGGLRRMVRRLAQAGMFAAARGIAYTLGCAFTAWLIVWITQR